MCTWTVQRLLKLACNLVSMTALIGSCAAVLSSSAAVSWQQLQLLGVGGIGGSH